MGLTSQLRHVFHSNSFTFQRRNLWGWLNSITNKVDPSRIEAVGAERAAAEWLLRCGASVRWRGHETPLTDYNSLPAGGFRELNIEEIDATGSCIMSVGFPHLKGLKNLKKVTLNKCHYLDGAALPMLAYVKNSLEELQLSSCGNIDDSHVQSLDCLSNLRHLLIYDLPEVRDREGCVAHLKTALPECDVQFPYAQAGESGEPVPKSEQ